MSAAFVARSLLVVAATACGRIGFDPSTAGDARGDAPADACTAPWSAPEALTALNTSGTDFGAQISADGLSIVFDSNILGASADLYTSQRASRSAAWDAPTLLDPFNTGAGDGDGSLTADGLEIMFASDRTGVGDWCLYTATRSTPTAVWTAARRLDTLCTMNKVSGPFLTPDGLRLYYNTRITNGQGDILVSTRPSRTVDFPVGQPVPGIPTGGMGRGYAALTGDELEIYFETGIPFQIHHASRPTIDAPFGAASPVPELASAFEDGDVSVTADGNLIVWGSTRGAGDYDLYQISRACP